MLGLGIYAVVAQGGNEYYDSSLLHISKSANHICLNSIGLPFAQLLEIDNAVRKAIRSGVHPPSDIYMDEHFYHSLRFSLEFDKNAEPSAAYHAPLSSTGSDYYFSSIDKILENLAPELPRERGK